MKRGAKKAAGSPWRAALDRPAHARKLDWAGGWSAADVAAGVRAELAASLAERDSALEALARQDLSVLLPAPVAVHGKARPIPSSSCRVSRLLAIGSAHEGRDG